MTPTSLLFFLSTVFISINFSTSFTGIIASRQTKQIVSLNSMTTSEELIPRDVLFGNPKYASPQLSPDGKYLSYLAPSAAENVLNVFVKLTNEPLENARMITDDKSRGIRMFRWAEDSETILYMQDFKGDENFHLWSINVKDEDALCKDLTPGENIKVSNLMTNKRFPNEILIGTNQRDKKCFDMYRCEYKTGGKLTLDTQNPGDVVG